MTYAAGDWSEKLSFPGSRVSLLGLLPGLPICDPIEPVLQCRGCAAVAGQCMVQRQLRELSSAHWCCLPPASCSLAPVPQFLLAYIQTCNPKVQTKAFLPARSEMLPALLVSRIPPKAGKPGRAPVLRRFLLTPQPGA